MFQGWGFYEDELLGFSHTLNILAKKGRLILEKDSFNTNNIKNAPALLLANGPSLDGDLKWIKENKNKFVIFDIHPNNPYPYISLLKLIIHFPVPIHNNIKFFLL